MKKGLVLEGGAMRGLFTAGVLDVMLEHNIEFDGAVGVSAGACFGCNYKSKQIGRTLRYNKRFAKDKRYCSLYSLLTTGDLYGADFCYHEIPEKLDVFDEETYENNPMEFYVVCTDAETGEPVYHRIDTGNEENLEWIRASASMPVVSRAVEIGGKKLLDGGISDSIPLDWFTSIGYDRNVVVLTRPADYVKEPLLMKHGMKLLLKKYPAVYEKLLVRHEMYNRTTEKIREMQKKGEVFVIQPAHPLGIGKVEHDPEKMEQVYRIGRMTMEAQLADLKKFIKSM